MKLSYIFILLGSGIFSFSLQGMEQTQSKKRQCVNTPVETQQIRETSQNENNHLSENELEIDGDSRTAHCENENELEAALASCSPSNPANNRTAGTQYPYPYKDYRKIDAMQEKVKRSASDDRVSQKKARIDDTCLDNKPESSSETCVEKERLTQLREELKTYKAGHLLNSLDSPSFNPHTPITPRGGTLLHLAAYHGIASLLTTLITQKHADVNILSNEERTPMHSLCIKGHVDVARCLLSLGASSRATSRGNITPLHLAAYYGHTELVDLLLEHGAALHLDLPASLDSKRKIQETPLQIAASRGHAAVVRSLLKQKSRINLPDLNGYTALHSACMHNHPEVVKVLVEDIRLMINLPDQSGWAALHYACEKGYLEVARRLLKAGASIEVLSPNKWTPLHVASYYKQPAVVALLLESGADLQAKDNVKQTPLDLAIDPEVKRLLQEALAKNNTK